MSERGECDHCGSEEGVPTDNVLGTIYICPECAQDAAEHAYETFLENYYGGDTPQTIQEQHQAAWGSKRKLR